ncbi:hypothetical protein [Aquimarina sp. AU474]|uniref:hypothetical protein n=1 Tax=Aquimarina sp. AU474 TaxID=2108529 RepID=UPI00190F0E44|nr:hypothetical protein [Aquimarina sp. AU474]
MKLSYLLIVLSLTIFSCKSEKSENEKTESSLIRGEFILIDDAAVIKGNGFIYGVVIDERTKELAKKVKPLQREEYDMVPVVIKGIIKSNPNQGWEEVVEIKEIIGVSAPTSELPTKIETSDKDQSSNENKNTEN